MTKKYESAISQWINGYKTKNNLSTSDIAKLCQLPEQTINEIESGQKSFPFDKAFELKSKLSSKEVKDLSFAIAKDVKNKMDN